MKKYINDNGDADIEEFLGAVTDEDGDFFRKVETRDGMRLKKRSIICSAS